MATAVNGNALPPGFVLDGAPQAPAQTQGLPPGFVLDGAPPAQAPVQDETPAAALKMSPDELEKFDRNAAATRARVDSPFQRNLVSAIPVVGGMPDRLDAFLRSTQTGRTYKDELSRVHAENSAMDNSSNTNYASSWAGSIAGLGVGGVGFIKLLPKVFGASTATKLATTTTGNAALGAGVSAAESVADNDSLGTVGIRTGLGAIAGAGGAKLASMLAPSMSALAGRVAQNYDALKGYFTDPATRVIAKHLSSADVPDARLAMAVYKSKYGEAPALHQLIPWIKQGGYAEAVAADPALAVMAASQQKGFGDKAPTFLQNMIEGLNGAPLPTAKGVADGKSAFWRTNMADIADRQIPLDAGLARTLDDKAVRVAMSDGVTTIAEDATAGRRIADAVFRLNDKQPNVSVTLGDVDAAVRSMNKKIKAAVVGKDDSTIQAYTALRDDLLNVIRTAEPRRYDDISSAYKMLSDYERGMASGGAGSHMHTIKEPRTRASVNTPEGAVGHTQGLLAGLRETAGSGETGMRSVLKDLQSPNWQAELAEALGPDKARYARDFAEHMTKALDTVKRTAPSAVKSEVSGNVALDVAHGIGALSAGSKWSMAYHALKLVGSKLGITPSDSTMKRAAQMLSDPSKTQQALKALRKMGYDDAAIKEAAAQVGATQGGRVSSIFKD